MENLFAPVVEETMRLITQQVEEVQEQRSAEIDVCSPLRPLGLVVKTVTAYHTRRRL